MTKSELPETDLGLGPPVLLKKLGNAIEANLAKNKLATAGIPAFLAGENTFAGDVMNPLPYREVELYVPQSLVGDALEVLEAPPSDPAELAGEPYFDDPARALSFRAFVASVVGWLFFILTPSGVFLAVPAFVYAIYLGCRAIAVSADRGGATIFKCVAALLVSAAGIAASFTVIVMLFR
jgi:hypothetical protein